MAFGVLIYILIFTVLDSFTQIVPVYTKFSYSPIWPGLFWYIRYRGGHIVPPLSILGLGGVRVPILFGNDLPMND